MPANARALVTGDEIPPIDEVISALKSRCKWGRLRSALKEEELETGSGWDSLFKNAEGKTETALRLNSFLRKYYVETILAANRYVQLYQIDELTVCGLLKNLTNAVVQPSIFSATYPYPIAKDEIQRAPTSPTLTHIASVGGGDIALVYCSSRYSEERQTYEYNKLSRIVQQVYSGIDELITIKRVFFQAYDLVIIRNSLNRLEICIDHPEKNSTDLHGLALSILAAAVNNLPLLTTVFQTGALNIFDAIGGIFKNKKEGTVHRMSFRTSTGSVKIEKMFENTDLRNEQFHQAGMTALKHEVQPHDLQVSWEFSSPRGVAEVRLSASVRELSNERPCLTGCYVDASSPSAFLQVLNKVVKYT